MPAVNPNVSLARVVAIGALYVAGAALPELHTALANPERINWPLTICGMAIASVATLRAYLDGSIEKRRAQDEAAASTEAGSDLTANNEVTQ